MSDINSGGKIMLKGDLSISDAEGIRNNMIAVLKEFATVTVNFSTLEDLDSSIIQLLYALCLQAKKERKEIIFEGTYTNQVRKRFCAAGLISSVDLHDDLISTQLTQKIRIAL